MDQRTRSGIFVSRPLDVIQQNLSQARILKCFDPMRWISPSDNPCHVLVFFEIDSYAMKKHKQWQNFGEYV